MPCETWQTFDRVLLVYGDPTCELISLRVAVKLVRQALPLAHLTLLTPEGIHTKLQIPGLEIIAWAKWGGQRFSPLRKIQPILQKLGDRQWDAAIIFTPPAQSPYLWAYLCYLAGIPIRVGQSLEFGGGVLSQCIVPPLETVSTTDYYLHLLRSLGLTATESQRLVDVK